MANKEEQFKQVIAENDDRILRICRYYAPSNEEQKDIYQEILINIWKSLANFRGEAALSTWIYRVAVNTALSFTGKAFKRMKLHVDFETKNLSSLGNDEEFEQKIREEEQLNQLQTELNQLSVIDKALVSLILEGLSMREIADIIGITEPNARVKIHRIKEMLRKKMKGGKDEKK